MKTETYNHGRHWGCLHLRFVDLDLDLDFSRALDLARVSGPSKPPALFSLAAFSASSFGRGLQAFSASSCFSALRLGHGLLGAHFLAAFLASFLCFFFAALLPGLSRVRFGILFGLVVIIRLGPLLLMYRSGIRRRPHRPISVVGAESWGRGSSPRASGAVGSGWEAWAARGARAAGGCGGMSAEI